MRQPAARTRYQQSLKARGVPVELAKSIHVRVVDELALPVYVASLATQSTARLLMIDGRTGREMPNHSVECTKNFHETCRKLSAVRARNIRV